MARGRGATAVAKKEDRVARRAGFEEEVYNAAYSSVIKAAQDRNETFHVFTGELGA
jgi:hypothetical protein